MYDHGKQDVKISIIPDGRRLITVNGIPRTVVPSLQLEKYDSNGNRYYEDAPEGNYNLCWLIEEKVGGYFEVAPDGGFLCYRTREGNPVVDLPDNILDDYSSVIPRLDLPALDNFIELDPILYGDYWYPIFWGGAGYMYNSSLLDYAGVEQCNVLPFGDFSNLLGLFSSGEQAYYDGRIELDLNTLESPIPDGGGQKAMTGTFCSNVAKNFLNCKFLFSIHR
jgi:hypothetical protein